MNGRNIPGARFGQRRFRLTNVIPERIIFVSRGITVLAFPWQQWLRERALILRLYAHFLSCRHFCRSIRPYAAIRSYCSLEHPQHEVIQKCFVYWTVHHLDS